jgi:hypothetical protein
MGTDLLDTVRIIDTDTHFRNMNVIEFREASMWAILDSLEGACS